MINRYSSRLHKLDESFLNPRLKNAQSYDRIAGYFTSSILEVAGESIETIKGKIRIICNSEIDVRDMETARSAAISMRREWCGFEPENLTNGTRNRFTKLYDLLRKGKLEVKVLPSNKFGLIHGKAGVITKEDGTKTSFLGSINETFSAWKLNYELIWEDDSPDAIQWVQEEFDALWNNPYAQPLSEFIIEDIKRISYRKVIPDVDQWRESNNPAAPVIETPVFRSELGLWEHQKFFVDLAFKAHQHPEGARYVLADMVGLGKTIQLATTALLIALTGNKPILVIAPKTLLPQWQEELMTLLDFPSAIWTGKEWIDENGIKYPSLGPEGIKKCPRRLGLVSQGLIIRGSEPACILKELTYDCIIVDEAHKARRKNLGPDKDHERPEPNNLLSFLMDISPRTKSMLLATATPVQLYPIEAWDLLNVLSPTNIEHILGNAFSHWRKPVECLPLILNPGDFPKSDDQLWEWVRNPIPKKEESRDFTILRNSIGLKDDEFHLKPEDWDVLNPREQSRIRNLGVDFINRHNPFIRHIVRRTREFLENEIDPETNEPYLQKVEVKLLGDNEDDAIRLPTYLQDAYDIAEEFCQLLANRVKGFGFIKTLLLRRVCSSIDAGLLTAQKMLSTWEDEEDIDSEDEELELLGAASNQEKTFKTLTEEERALLQRFVSMLEANQEKDPKFEIVEKLLMKENWLEDGCIIFSQYYDSIWSLAKELSKHLPEESIGIYAGSTRSGIMKNEIFQPCERESLKKQVKKSELRLLLGTDAASEGLNLQRLGTLINFDLPWNPTRLEQRKGRIQRIGQTRETVLVYNLRYKGSVEDRVHQLLSERLSNIHQLFGQIPDILEDAWIQVAIGDIESARRTIDAVPERHPFEMRYNKIEKVEWESCSEVLNSYSKKKFLMEGWK